MKNRRPKDEEPHGKGGEFKGSTMASTMHQKKKKRKNMKRLGGGGLSLEAFAGMKSNRNQYNPALIKKQREFYKNAKYVSKYKKSLKQLNQQNNIAMPRPSEHDEADDGNLNLAENNKLGDSSRTDKKNRRTSSQSLQELYEKRREEEERARMERDAITKARREEREKAEARRKAERKNMLRRTRTGQPVMKYQIERLLQNI